MDQREGSTAQETTITFRLSSDLRDEIEDLAEANDRSVAAEIRQAIRDRIASQKGE